jgi:hypothetical protein
VHEGNEVVPACQDETSWHGMLYTVYVHRSQWRMPSLGSGMIAILFFLEYVDYLLHIVAAGATICSQCQAGAYSSGAGMDASVAEKSSEDDKADIVVCLWMQ